jgi:hypothetical protein
VHRRLTLLIITPALLVIAAGAVVVFSHSGDSPRTVQAAASPAATSEHDRPVSTMTPTPVARPPGFPTPTETFPPGYPEEWALNSSLENWPEDPPVPEEHGGIGDTLTFTDSMGGTGTITLHGMRRTTQKAADSRFAPDPQWSYLIFDLTITSTEGLVSPDPSKLRVQSDQGWHRFTPVPTPVMLGLTLLDTGQSTRGLLGFDAPPGQLRLDYNDRNGPVASFMVDS